MDAEQIAQLRGWARRLEAREDDGELRAAGKAILLLVGELERLQAEGLSVGEPVAEETVGEAFPEEDEEPEETSLRSRLRRTFGYG
jgi:hypothetical protein